MTSQTIENPMTHTLAEIYASGDNALGNEEDISFALTFYRVVSYYYQHDEYQCDSHTLYLYIHSRNIKSRDDFR